MSLLIVVYVNMVYYTKRKANNLLIIEIENISVFWNGKTPSKATKVDKVGDVLAQNRHN